MQNGKGNIMDKSAERWLSYHLNAELRALILMLQSGGANEIKMERKSLDRQFSLQFALVSVFFFLGKYLHWHWPQIATGIPNFHSGFAKALPLGPLYKSGVTWLKCLRNYDFANRQTGMCVYIVQYTHMYISNDVPSARIKHMAQTQRFSQFRRG